MKKPVNIALTSLLLQVEKLPQGKKFSIGHTSYYSMCVEHMYGSVVIGFRPVTQRF